MTRYVVLRVRGGTEIAVRDRLAARGVEGLAPSEDARSARGVRIERAILTQYVFAAGDLGQALGTQGVSGALRTSDGAAATVDLAELQRMGKPAPADECTFRPGDLVTITDGAFAGHRGTITRRKKQMANVSVSLFGRAVLCTMHVSQLRAS